MAIKAAINGFGRIGRCVARIIATRSDIELTINDTAEASMLEYITKYDTVMELLKVMLKLKMVS